MCQMLINICNSMAAIVFNYFFFQAICKFTFKEESSTERGTMYYFKVLLNAKNVKGKVKNSFRAHKLLYYSVYDAICCLLFMMELNVDDDDEMLPSNFHEKTSEEKISWLNDVCCRIVKKWMFESKEDMFEQLRDVLGDPEHVENYFVTNEDDNRFHCHFCPKSFVQLNTVKLHEKQLHQHTVHSSASRNAQENEDELYNHVVLIFKLVCLLKNLDTSIDMGDGSRSVRSAKYELPIFNKTNKIKYAIGCIHLTTLTEETLSAEQSQRLVNNRNINLQGGKNNNLALDEYLEMLNRDSKELVKGHQTKKSIISHSKEFPHLINFTKHFDDISGIRGQKGFHRLPEYQADVQKVIKELKEISALEVKTGRKLACKRLACHRDPFAESFHNLPSLIRRHKPSIPFSRLRNPNY